MTEVSAFLRGRTSLLALALAVILLVVTIAVLPSFAAPASWAGTLAAFAPFAIAAMASTPVILGGGIDLSVGPLLTLVNIVLVAVLIPAGLGNPLVAVPALLLLGAAIGAVTGALVAVLRFPAIIATLCVLFVLVGINLKLAPVPRSGSTGWLDVLGGSWGPVPGAVLTIGAPVLLWALLRRTAYVRGLEAAGGDEVAAYSAGVPVTALRVVAFALSGLFAAVGGIAMAALVKSADASQGLQLTLVALAAVGLGGTSFAGGRGGLLGSLIGAACIFLIQNLLNALHITALWLQVAYGGLLVLAVITSTRLGTATTARRLA